MIAAADAMFPLITLEGKKGDAARGTERMGRLPFPGEAVGG